MNRIEKLCSYLDKCNTFADVGCDHGYCTKYMLENNLCENAVISDISEKCLEKAEKLLSAYIKSGRCRSVCCFGLELIGESVGEIVDQALIAGMGGEEIVNILKNSFIPGSFVLQPMKNADVLREYLLFKECEIVTDDIFTDGKKYYFIIKGKSKGVRYNYNEAEIKYGKDSLSNPVFNKYLSEEIFKKKGYLTRKLSAQSRYLIEQEIAFMEGVLKGEIT